MRSPWGSPRRRRWERRHESSDHRGELGGLDSRGGDAGSVTAEFAVVLPAVVLVLGACLGAVQVAGQQVRLTDAAASAARSLARDDRVAQATAIVEQAVSGAALSSERHGRFVCARLTAKSAFVPFAAAGLRLEAASCALAGGL